MLMEILDKLIYLALVAGVLPGQEEAVGVTIKADRDRVAMGRTVQVDVEATLDDGQPASGWWVLPYVNERRWGAHEVTDENGCVKLLLPLPNPGPAQIQAQVLPPVADPFWIWAKETRENQTIYLLKSFTLKGTARRASMNIVVDEVCKVYLNGHHIGDASGFTEHHIFEDLERWLRPGDNILAVEAINGTPPAGFKASLDMDTDQRRQILITDTSWRYMEETPDGWPEPSGSHGEPIRLVDPVYGSSWWAKWPDVPFRDQLFTGCPIPKDAELSNMVTVQVERRSIEVAQDPDHLIGMQYGTLYNPRFFNWNTSQAVPIVGFYHSYDLDVIRQHTLWLMDAGVNWIFIDWANHIWGKQHWNERDDATNWVNHNTALLLEVFARMREEGLPAPMVVIMTGLTNGPPTTMEAINEEHEWIYHNLVRNPRFNGLWVEYEGKPLVVSLDTGGLAVREGTPPVDDTHLTIRWMGAQLQGTRLDQHGYWSWMDGSLQPILTYYNG